MWYIKYEARIFIRTEKCHSQQKNFQQNPNKNSTSSGNNMTHLYEKCLSLLYF